MHAVETERTPEGKTVPIDGTDFEIEADLVLLAIGFTGPVRDRFLQDMDLGYTERGAIPTPRTVSAPARPASSSPATPSAGPSLIVRAIAEGRKAARQADEFLMGRSLLPG